MVKSNFKALLHECYYVQYKIIYYFYKQLACVTGSLVGTQCKIRKWQSRNSEQLLSWLCRSLSRLHRLQILHRAPTRPPVLQANKQQPILLGRYYKSSKKEPSPLPKTKPPQILDAIILSNLHDCTGSH